MGSRIVRALVLLCAAAALVGCSESTAVDTKELAKEIPPPKDPNRNFSEKMEKYKIGGPNSPPGMKGADPQTPKKGG